VLKIVWEETMKLSIMPLVILAQICAFNCEGRGEEEPGEQQVVSKRWGFSLTCPRDWTTKTYPNSTNLVKADLSKGNMGINVRLYDRSSHADFDGFVAWYRQQFEQDMRAHRGEIREVGSGTFNCGQLPGKYIRYRSTNRGGQWLLKQYLIPEPQTKRVFVFQAGCKWEQRNRAAKQLDAVVATLRLL
jgi:hypothetical protein